MVLSIITMHVGVIILNLKRKNNFFFSCFIKCTFYQRILFMFLFAVTWWHFHRESFLSRFAFPFKTSSFTQRQAQTRFINTGFAKKKKKIESRMIYHFISYFFFFSLGLSFLSSTIICDYLSINIFNR